MMSPCLVFVSLFLCVVSVAGNVMAGPYQTVWLWYAYRLDGMTSTPEMALGCHGTAPNGRCYFDEFLRYIEKGPWEGHTAVGKTEDPDVERTVEELKSIVNTGDPKTEYVE